jgi:hypothetical protein
MQLDIILIPQKSRLAMHPSPQIRPKKLYCNSNIKTPRGQNKIFLQLFSEKVKNFFEWGYIIIRYGGNGWRLAVQGSGVKVC